VTSLSTAAPVGRANIRGGQSHTFLLKLGSGSESFSNLRIRLQFKPLQPSV